LLLTQLQWQGIKLGVTDFPCLALLGDQPPKPSVCGGGQGAFAGALCGTGTVSTHIHSEVLEALELAEVFLQFAVNVQIFGFGIF